MRYCGLKTSEEIKDALCQFKDCFPRLVNRVGNIDAYVEKIASRGITIVYKDMEAIKGIICFYANDRVNLSGYISLIWIKQENREEGIGTKLLKHCLEVMKEKGMKSVELEVQPDNTKAITFYKKNGFIEKRIEYEENRNYMILFF